MQIVEDLMEKDKKLLLSPWNWMRLMILALCLSAGGFLFAAVESSNFQVQSSDQTRIVVDFSTLVLYTKTSF